ncbi:MAG: 6-bladed beta-propeller [Acidobacteriota bacterium]|nr:6-bladed beta-propeller [Acidobacteriota bacterium]
MKKHQGAIVMGFCLVFGLGIGFVFAQDLKSESIFKKWFKEQDKILIDTSGLSVSALREIHVRPEGNIVFLDPRAGCLFEFDSSGKFIRKIGGRGQGPGEFMMPIAACLDFAGHLYVADSKTRRVSIFNQDGSFVSSFIHAANHGYPSIMRTDSHRNLFLEVLALPPEGRIMPDWFYKYSANGRALGSFFEAGTDTDWILSMYPRFAFDLSGDTIYAMQIHAYEINLIDADGKLLKTIGEPPDYWVKPEFKNRISGRSFRSQTELVDLLTGLSKSWTRIIKLQVIEGKYIVVMTLANGLVRGIEETYLLDIWTIEGRKVVTGIPSPYALLCSDAKGNCYFLLDSTEETALDEDPKYTIGKFKIDAD